MPVQPRTRASALASLRGWNMVTLLCSLTRSSAIPNPDACHTLAHVALRRRMPLVSEGSGSIVSALDGARQRVGEGAVGGGRHGLRGVLARPCATRVAGAVARFAIAASATSLPGLVIQPHA